MDDSIMGVYSGLPENKKKSIRRIILALDQSADEQDGLKLLQEFGVGNENGLSVMERGEVDKLRTIARLSSDLRAFISEKIDEVYQRAIAERLDPASKS